MCNTVRKRSPQMQWAYYDISNNGSSPQKSENPSLFIKKLPNEAMYQKLHGDTDHHCDKHRESDKPTTLSILNLAHRFSRNLSHPGNKKRHFQEK